LWRMWTVTDEALNGPFSHVIVSYASQQMVEVGGESSLHSGGSVRVTNENVTRVRAATLPFGREGNLPDPGRELSGDVGDATTFPVKSVVFAVSLGLKCCRVERGDLSQYRSHVL